MLSPQDNEQSLPALCRDGTPQSHQGITTSTVFKMPLKDNYHPWALEYKNSFEVSEILTLLRLPLSCSDIIFGFFQEQPTGHFGETRIQWAIVLSARSPGLVYMNANQIRQHSPTPAVPQHYNFRYCTVLSMNYEDLLQSFQLPELSTRRLYLRLSLMFKIVHESFFFPSQYFCTHELNITSCKTLYVSSTFCSYQFLLLFICASHYFCMECFAWVCNMTTPSAFKNAFISSLYTP